jgi:hypothetical protein
VVAVCHRSAPDAFVQAPEKYAPQFGGYCSWAVAHGYTADGDPEAWKIVDGRLYVNYSKRVQRKWEENIRVHQTGSGELACSAEQMTAERSLHALALKASLMAPACSSTPTSPSSAPTTSTTSAAGAPVRSPATARYRAPFQVTWSDATHPVDFPAAAHFSPLVGGTHNAQVTFWREGANATDGIKDMAERGLTSTLSTEINVAIAAGTAEHVFTGGNIAVSPGTATAEFEISQTYPLVTLVSMIAPSPDWFVAVSAVPLFQGGQWTSELRVNVDPWDAGTDGGVTFESPDLPLVLRLSISRIVTAPLSPLGRVTPLGTFTFTRIQ